MTLEAFRDLTYPLGVGSYDAYAIPRRGFITEAEWNGSSVSTVRRHRDRREVPAQLSAGAHAAQVRAAADLRRAAPECRYIVTDADGRVVLAGVATLGADANFQIDLRDRLPAGRYMLSALMAVNGNVMNPDIRRIEIALPFQR